MLSKVFTLTISSVSLTRAEFKNIFDKHFDEVRNYIYYRCGDADLATDVAQETFLKVWEKQFDNKENKIKGLLFKIAGDQFISTYRKQKTVMDFKLNLKPEQENLTAVDQMEFQELQQRYSTALAALPEKQRVVFMMSRMEELKYHEIAERLNLSIKAVEKRMKNALDFLRQELIQK